MYKGAASQHVVNLYSFPRLRRLWYTRISGRYAAFILAAAQSSRLASLSSSLHSYGCFTLKPSHLVVVVVVVAVVVVIFSESKFNKLEFQAATRPLF